MIKNEQQGLHRIDAEMKLCVTKLVRLVVVVAKVCEGTFFETEIEFKTISLSKPEIEARLRQ